ncbi:MAG TPA: type IV pili methyl-accepting chemotaxis transducer N-terminal domain-containing protein, partial [Gammaproteobacteria bacterium]|nr:type IV pili methyl-accepting chemotaxis transducer N-terminal domain-containing protein [Gammaproteobacteria bacterium]
MNRQSAQGAGSKTASKTPIVVLSLGLLLSIGMLVALIVHIARQSGYEEQYQLRAGEQRVVSQRIEKSALAAASGKTEGFVQLRASRDEFERLVSELKTGVPALGVPASPPEVSNELNAMDSAWQKLRQNADDILANQQSIVSVREFVSRITGLIPKL